jgi:class 3 adenylate cyclase
MNIIEHPRLYRLLALKSELNQDKWREVEDYIWNMFGQEAAVLVTDMSYFSKVTKELGIVYYLTMIKNMQDIVSMSVVRHQGEVIKFVADNSFSIFASVDQAVAAVIEINRDMASFNRKTAKERDIVMCSGIDYGKFLNINGSDLYGETVNLASVLGEDIAGSFDILLSENAYQQLDSKQDYQFSILKQSLSGVDMNIMKLGYEIESD